MKTFTKEENYNRSESEMIRHTQDPFPYLFLNLQIDLTLCATFARIFMEYSVIVSIFRYAFLDVIH